MYRFYVEETCEPNIYSVYFDTSLVEKLPNFCYHGSLHVVAARTLGYSYVEYLKFCSVNGATLRGREGYTYPVYKNKEDATKVCQILNENWVEVEEYLKEVIINERKKI